MSMKTMTVMVVAVLAGCGGANPEQGTGDMTGQGSGGDMIQQPGSDMAQAPCSWTLDMPNPAKGNMNMSATWVPGWQQCTKQGGQLTIDLQRADGSIDEFDFTPNGSSLTLFYRFVPANTDLPAITCGKWFGTPVVTTANGTTTIAVNLLCAEPNSGHVNWISDMAAPNTVVNGSFTFPN